MKTIRSGFLGIMAALLSGMFVFSILSLAVVEGMISIPPTATIHPTLFQPNLTPIPVIRITTTALFMQTSTQPPQPTECPPPAGWQLYFVQPGDSLADLAAMYSLSLAELMEANCLISSQLVANVSIYLPPPTPTSSPARRYSPTACTPPPGWILYTIRPGDTLSIISRQFQISITLLMQANCLTNEFIIAGNTLWVPNVPTTTPLITPTASFTLTLPPPAPSDTPTHTSTPTLVVPSSSPSPTMVLPTDTVTLTPVPSETPTVTSTYTPNPGQTKKVPTGTETPESASH